MTTVHQTAIPQAAVASQYTPPYIPKLTPTNLFLIFLVTSFAGAIIETIFMLVVWGELQNRSGLLWGQFSLVWGIGAVIITVCLRGAARKGPGLVFVGGTVLGGGFEFFCSWLQETLFGVRFWDYSHLAFSIDGRVNVVFCLFWGAASFFWLCVILPALFRQLDRLPVKPLRVVSSVLAILLIADVAFSALALERMAQRSHNLPADNAVEVFLDEHFTDQMLFSYYSSMCPAA